MQSARARSKNPWNLFASAFGDFLKMKKKESIIPIKIPWKTNKESPEIFTEVFINQN